MAKAKCCFIRSWHWKIWPKASQELIHKFDLIIPQLTIAEDISLWYMLKLNCICFISSSSFTWFVFVSSWPPPAIDYTHNVPQFRFEYLHSIVSVFVLILYSVYIKFAFVRYLYLYLCILTICMYDICIFLATACQLLPGLVPQFRCKFAQALHFFLHLPTN